MSKGNGRHRINSMGNGMDKFHGTCNGKFNNSNSGSSDDISLDYELTKNVPDSDIISGNINRARPGKGYKSKLK